MPCDFAQTRQTDAALLHSFGIYIPSPGGKPGHLTKKVARLLPLNVRLFLIVGDATIRDGQNAPDLQHTPGS